MPLKALLAFMLAMPLVGLAAAHYSDGLLYIEVLIWSGESVRVASAGGDHLRISLSELESPLTRDIQTPFNIRAASLDQKPGWKVLERSEPLTDSSDGVLRESFTWQDSTLVIKCENLIYSERTFPDQEAAKRYAREAGMAEREIQVREDFSATVFLSGDNLANSFWEAPLHLSTPGLISFGGSKLAFSGEFNLKIVNKEVVITQILPLDDYVSGVIANEIGNSAPREAMKAQAVTARTHALSLLLANRHEKDCYDLCNTTHCQVYKGGYLQNEAVRAAVAATRNEILTVAGRIADATYHSACGGKTDSSQNIWDGEPLPHLSGVICEAEAADYDLTREQDARSWISAAPVDAGGSSWEASALAWSKQLERTELARNVGLQDIDHVVINRRGYSGRIIDISFYGETTVRLTSEYRIRQAFGSARSSFFHLVGGYVQADNGGVVIYPDETISIKGRGSGHGVGMCQVGTLERARAGEDYMKILLHYYPGTEMSRHWMENGAN